MINSRTVFKILSLALLLPWVGVQAQAPVNPEHWQMCKPDLLAGDLMSPSGAPARNAPLFLSADQGQSSPSEALLEGNVEAYQGDQRLQASALHLDRLANRLQAEGEITYGNPNLAVRGSHAEWDLDREQGIFKEAQYYLPSRHGQGQAEQVVVDRANKQSQLEQATFSTCIRGEEFWQLRSRKLHIDENTGRGSARDITLAIKGVPVMYFPYLSFPITDERQSGFLVPNVGYESGNGFDIRIPYYWNIAPNRDLTIAPRILTNRGLLLGGEYRFLNRQDHGVIRLEYLPDDRKLGDDRSAIDIRHQANLLPNLNTDLLYEYVSDDDYLKDLSNSIGLFLPSYLEQHLNTLYASYNWTAKAQVQRFQIIDKEVFANPDDEPYDRLPQLSFDGAWLQRSYGLSYMLQSELVHFARDHGVTGNRLDLQPGISLPMEWPAGFLTPRLSYRYTAYDLGNAEPGADASPSRSAPVLSLDSGLFLERPVQWRWWGNQADLQTLEPRLFYLYVPFRSQTGIPNFDSAEVDTGYPWLFLENRFAGADRLGDANQLTTALTTRLLNSSDGRERLRASIGQIYYFHNPRVTLEDDSDTEASAPGIIAEGLMYLRPDISLRGVVEWHEHSGNTRRSGLDLRYDSGSGHLFNFAHRYMEAELEQLDISLLWPLSEQWHTVARWNYSLREGRNMDALAGFEYRECCWAFRMVARQRRDSPKDEDVKNAVFLELELTGLTGIGTNINKLLEEAILGYRRY